MRSLPGGFRRRYGASPWSLLLTLGSFALTLYAGVRLLAGDALGVVLWFVGAAVVHDLVLLPLYTAADRGLQALLARRPAGGEGRAAAARRLNAVRVPAFLSALLFVVSFPLILGRVGHYEATTGLPGDTFGARWLLLTAALFAVPVLWSAAARLLRGRASAGRGTGPDAGSGAAPAAGGAKGAAGGRAARDADPGGGPAPGTGENT